MENIARLLGREYNGYLLRKFPSPLDDVVERVIEDYLSRDSRQRELVLNAIKPTIADVLSVYGQRMAVVAVRSSSSAPLNLGLVAAGIGHPVLDDWRDNLYALVTLYDAAERVGQPLADILKSVKGDIPAAAYAFFNAFCEAPTRDKSLGSMGMGATGAGDDFLYV